MNNNRGFTLIEILISTAILLIAIAGFLAWTANVVHQRTELSKRDTAYNIAVDVSDRLAKLSGTNIFLLPNGTNKYLGLNSDGSLWTCTPAGAMNGPLQALDGTGITIFTEPWNGTTNQLILYDNDLGTFSGGGQLTANVNANIDHPNSLDNVSLINSIINPIRLAPNQVTYYAVWSVAYMPCSSAPTNLVKIFITVYWIEPEPPPLSLNLLNAGIKSGAFTLKNVSITLDKSLTATQ